MYHVACFRNESVSQEKATKHHLSQNGCGEILESYNTMTEYHALSHNEMGADITCTIPFIIRWALAQDVFDPVVPVV